MKYKRLISVTTIVLSICCAISGLAFSNSSNALSDVTQMPFTELDYSEDTKNGYLRATVIFEAPLHSTAEEILSHASQYIEKFKRTKTVFYVDMFYYDNSIYWRFMDNYMAEVRWSPSVDSMDALLKLAKKKDYSKHELKMEYSQYNGDDELSDEEREVYTELQEFTIHQIGKPLTNIHSFDEEDRAVVTEFSRMNNISYDKLLEIREKASNRWQEEIFTGGSMDNSLNIPYKQIMLGAGTAILGALVMIRKKRKYHKRN
nr:hypothetical protein [uncultured Anaerobutyricum sp.]